MATRIGIFVFDGAEELDWAGPWEVLAAWAQRYPEDDAEVFTVSRTAGGDHLRQGAASARRLHLENGTGDECAHLSGRKRHS
jgi:hypothetical protein